MGETENTLEELFSIWEEEEQKIKTRRCKFVCALGPKEKELLQAQITARLYHLLNWEPSHAFLVCQRCEGCPVLRRVLRGPCWGALLQVCCQQLEVGKDGQPWPPPHFPRTIRVLYTLLKEQPSQDHHQECQQKSQQENQQWTQQHQQESHQQYQQDCQREHQQKKQECQQEHHKEYHYQPPPLKTLLEPAYVALTLALLDGGPLAFGSHALVASTALCLLLQYLEPKRAAFAFLNTLWALNRLAEKRKAVINMIEAKDHFIIQEDTQEGIKEDTGPNSKQGHMQEEQRKEDTGTKSNKGSTHKRKKEKEDHKDTLTDKDKGHTTKITQKSTKATKSLTWEDVSTVIDTAKRGEEGRKLLRRNFEGMEGSYYSCTLLLQGMLNAREKWLFQGNEEEEGYGGKVFLYSLHPLLLKLCSGGAAQHTFQAFQTLHLWIRAVRELGTWERRAPASSSSKMPEGGYSGKVDEGVLDDLTTTITTTTTTTEPHPSKDALFSMTPGSQGPVFTLLNASWESPAKGVGEAVGKCVEELLSLHEDGTAGTRQQLARDMLQALLSSSNSSVTSVWTSKSTYPPLALVVTHLGCEEALHLYPSLPASLVSSLGVNHLAPATTSVYKVFLAQLGEASWSQHFLAPVSEALCSQDRLTQQHLFSLWLPPTLKKYPGIHWALLTSCNTTTPGWLARMALLKTARSMGALELGNEEKSARVKEGPLPSSQDESRGEMTFMSDGETYGNAKSDVFECATDKIPMSARGENSETGTKHVSDKNKTSFSAKNNNNPERIRIKAANSTKEDDSQSTREEALILPYIYAALRHRDENVRLEALALVCHTQKTSQPVSLFEAECLQSFLRWNMNIDSAPFRQGVLKSVAALLVRLRGATASYCKSQSAKRRKAVGKGPLQCAGSLKSSSMPRVMKRDTDQENFGDPRGNQQKVSSLESNAQNSIDLKRKQQRYPEKKLEGTAEEPVLACNRNQECEVPGIMPTSVLTTSADLVLWLVREAHRGMAPDANYQRRILALQLYKEVLLALLPSSVTLPYHGKHVTTNPDPLLMYLNTIAVNQRDVLGDGDVVTELPVEPSIQSSYNNKTNAHLSSNHHKEDAINHLPVKPSHQDTYGEKTTTDQLSNSLIFATTINNKNDMNESPTTLPFQGFCSDSNSITSNLHPDKFIFTNINQQKNTLQTYIHIDTKDKRRSTSHHSINPILDIYGDKRALDQPLINLAFPWTLNTLLYLCMDEMNDVRAEAREIIHLFTSQGKMHLSLSEGKEWMYRALKLCDSPKASDAESGGTLALTVALLIPKECLGEVLEGVPGMDSKDDDGGGDGKSCGGSNPPSPPSLAEYLLARIECQLAAAKTNLLRAARQAPIHGTLQALGHYIIQKKEKEEEEIKKKVREKTQLEETGRKKAWKNEEEEAKRRVATPSLAPSFLTRLASLLQRLVEFVLDTLSSTSPLGSAVPPSFAEMGEAVRKVVEEGTEEVKEEEDEKAKDTTPFSSSLLEQEQDEEEGLLSNDHVLVLSCCWQILKSCCEVTSQAIHFFADDPQATDDLIRAVVVRVLLGTRHKGAMEAARATYASVWSCLLQKASVGRPFGTPDPSFLDILHQQVSEVVWLLGAPRGTSVTRRAAGVAMMVQAACGAAPRLTPTLVSTTVTSLTTIACSKVGVDDSDTTDAPQALALHVLQSLALHSHLGPFLRPHLTLLTSTCLHAFASPSWAIRNAALQLFGSLVSSLVGQKKVRDDTSALNSLTTPEFLSRYPSLVHLLLAALEGDSRCHMDQKSAHHSASSIVVSDTPVHNDCSRPKAPNTLTLTQDTHSSAYTETHTPEYTKTHTDALHMSTFSQGTHTNTVRHAETDMPEHIIAHTFPHTEPHKAHTPSTDMQTDTHTLKHSPEHTQTYSDPHKDKYTSPLTGKQIQTHTPTHMQTHIKNASILVPVLSLVARLSPGTGLQQNPHLTNMLHRLWHSTACLLESPVCSVRRLAALALVSLTPSNEALPQALKILLKASDPTIPANLIHGHLLVLSSLLQTHPSLAEDSRLKESACMSLLWLLSPRNRCHVNTALALKIMMALSINIVDACSIPALNSSLPGAAACRHTLTLMKLSLWPRCTIEDLFLSELPVGSDILESCSDAFLDKIRDCHCASWLLRYEHFIWNQLENGPLTPKAMAALLRFLTAIMEKKESAGLYVPKHQLATLLSCMDGLQGSSATCAALVLVAHLMRHPASITDNILKAFAGAITRYSHPTASEDHRLAASAALRVALKSVLTCQPSVDLLVKEQLIVSTVVLLQDEDSSIRDTATAIVAALLTPSGVPHENSPHPQPTSHSNLALFEFFQWLADRGIEANDWTTLRVLWELCSGQANPEFSLPVTALTASCSRLFQPHSANLYYEPRQVSIMVGVAFMRVIQRRNGQAFVWKEKQQSPFHDKLHPGKEYNSRQNSNNGQENCETVNKDSSNPPLTSPRDWLEEETTKANSRGKALSNLASKHSFWHHRLLASKAGVYVVSCKVFQLLCWVFGVSPKLEHPLVWDEKGYCMVDLVR